MKKDVAIHLLAALLLNAQLHASPGEENYLRRINAHLLLQDHQSACEESQEAIRVYPNSQVLAELRIKALAKSGEEKEAYLAWTEYHQSYPDDLDARNRIAEEMAWGTVNKTAASSSPPLRILGILAAFLSQDARGIAIIKEGLRDPNILIRSATVKLAGNLHDAIIQDEVARLVRKEKVWKVRLEAINSAGAMKLKSVRPTLMAIAADPSCHALERASAVSALVQMQKKISSDELDKLIHSDRAGMRMLACEIVAHLELKEVAPQLMPLLGDHSADVRAKALHTVGLLRVPIDPEKGYVARLLNDPDTDVAMTAAWVMTLAYPEKGMEAFEILFKSSDEKVRRRAAAALTATGRYGIPLMEKTFERSQDPYVRLNIAIGLIGQRRQTDRAADTLYASLLTLKEQWMEDEESPFPLIVPSTLKHDELIPNYPEAVNQKTRLDLLNILAGLKHPRAQEAVKQFLQEKKWGITGMAAAVLLTEGDDQAVDIVQALLKDNNPAIRLQAALVLALWGGGKDSLAVLTDAYEKADYEEKEKILEGIGRVGMKESIPFLMEKLQEPHQTLRLIAAAGLIEILYN